MKRSMNKEEDNMSSKHKLHLTSRAKSNYNSIRAMFNKSIELDKKRSEQGLAPLLNLGIGAPHVESNPLQDILLHEFTQKKLLLRKEIEELELKILQNGKNVEMEKELSTKKKKLVKKDTYLPSQGDSKCCKAAADLVNYYFPFLNAQERQCCITNGASQALYVLLQVFVEPGVQVAAFSPFFPPYRKAVESLGGTWVSIPTLENCRPSIDLFTSTLSTNNISVIILNDPCNPSGIKMTPQELSDLGRVLSRPENKEIIIICDDTYHDLIFSENKDLFLDVVDKDEFLNRTCVVLSTSKCIVGSPGLRLGIAYTPDIKIDGKIEQVGLKLGSLMADMTCATFSVVQNIGRKIIYAKMGKSTPEKNKIHSQWESNILQVYSSIIKLAVSSFTEESGFPLVVRPDGAFFGIISGKKLIGKKIPEKVILLDGREVVDLHSKIGATTFETDVHISYFLLYGAETVTVPMSGFVFDEKKGFLRISLALEEQTLGEAVHRLSHAASQVI